MKPDVVLYTRPGCDTCRLAREYLSERGVEFRERDVSQDPAALQELRIMNAGGLPVILIDREAVVGFDKILLDDRLKAKGIFIGEPS